LFNLVLDGLRDLMKQMRACETRFKQPQNGAKLSSKLTLRNKRNRIREKHKKGRTHVKKK
jgi:hypothetical protein